MTLVNLLGDTYAVSDTSSPSFTGQTTLLGSGSSTGLVFGATAQAKIYVSTDATNGVLTLQAPGTGGGISLLADNTGPAILAGNGATGVKIQDSNNGGVYWAFSTTSGGWFPSAAYPLGSAANPVGDIYVQGGANAVLRSASTVTNGAGAGAGTLTNAPSAGDPTKWIPFNDNGTIRYFPSW